MKKGQTLSNQTHRKKTARDVWLRFATDFNADMAPVDIANKHINPRTGKPYSVKHVYKVLNKMRAITAE